MGWEDDAKRREEERLERAREYARKQKEYYANKRAEEKAKQAKIAREQRRKEEREALDQQVKEIQDRFELEKARAKENAENGPRTSFLATSALGFLSSAGGNSNRPRTEFGNPIAGFALGPGRGSGQSVAMDQRNQQHPPEGGEQNHSASPVPTTSIPKLWRPF